MKTYGTLKFIGPNDFFADGAWALDKIPPFVAIKLKDIFQGIRKSQTVPFYFTHKNETARDLEWFIDRYPVIMDASDRQKLEWAADDHRQETDAVQFIFSPDYVPPKVKLLAGELKKFQSVGLEIFKKVNRLLIADKVGLGKTLQAIAAMTVDGNLPALVCVQSHLPMQWKSEIEKWIGIKVHIVKGKKYYELPEADVYIFKYTNIYNWVDQILAMPFKFLAFDEIQEIRRVDSLKHEGVVKIAKHFNKVMALSGSPIYNYGAEVWNIYQAIKPEIFPSREVFLREWCTGHKGKIKDPKALGSYLRESGAYIRRTYEDVGSDIPPINKIIHTVGYDKRAINKMEKDAKTLAQAVLQGTFIERGQAARNLSVMVRKATGVSKARDVADYVKIILEGGEPVLLAGWHRDVYDIWNKELADYNPVMYTGTESEKQKNESKRKFIEGESNLMIISNRSGVGLDGLQHRARYVIIGELDWSRAIHEQIIGRLLRTGQLKQVTVIFLVTDSGSDPIVIDINGIKTAQFDGIFNPNAVDEKQINDDSIIKQFAQKFLNQQSEKK